MRTLLRVDVRTGTVTSENLPEEFTLLGGRALTSPIVAKEVDLTCDPMGPQNKIVFAPGLLGGTKAPSSGRLSVGCKSPPTGAIPIRVPAGRGYRRSYVISSSSWLARTQAGGTGVSWASSRVWA